MIEWDEGIFAFILMNCWVSQFLYIASILYRFINFKALQLKWLGSLFAIFFPPVLLLMVLYVPHNVLFDFILPILGILCLLFDFFQNHKKCHLCAYSSLLMAHLCILIPLGSFLNSNLILLLYFAFANLYLSLLFFAKGQESMKAVFIKSLYFSLPVSFFVFCITWLKGDYGEFLVLSYLAIYLILNLCLIVLIGIYLYSYLIKYFYFKK